MKCSWREVEVGKSQEIDFRMFELFSKFIDLFNEFCAPSRRANMHCSLAEPYSIPRHTTHNIELDFMQKLPNAFLLGEFGKHEGSIAAASEIFIHSTRLRSHALIIVAQQIIPRRLENQSRAEGKNMCVQRNTTARGEGREKKRRRGNICDTMTPVVSEA